MLSEIKNDLLSLRRNSFRLFTQHFLHVEGKVLFFFSLLGQWYSLCSCVFFLKNLFYFLIFKINFETIIRHMHGNQNVRQIKKNTLEFPDLQLLNFWTEDIFTFQLPLGSQMGSIIY